MFSVKEATIFFFLFYSNCLSIPLPLVTVEEWDWKPNFVQSVNINSIKSSLLSLCKALILSIRSGEVEFRYSKQTSVAFKDREQSISHCTSCQRKYQVSYYTYYPIDWGCLIVRLEFAHKSHGNKCEVSVIGLLHFYPFCDIFAQVSYKWKLWVNVI